ncbi:MAG: hypothetical protein MI725_11715, partial [Pirellulales bacterium]|nr:hypothetical protein [Pirellulales bacterium]
MNTCKRPTAHLLLITFTLQMLYPATAQAEHLFGRMARLAKEHHYHGTPPAVCEDGHIDKL